MPRVLPPPCGLSSGHSLKLNSLSRSLTIFAANHGTRVHGKRLPKNLRYPRRDKLPPAFGTNLFLKKTSDDTEQTQVDPFDEEGLDLEIEEEAGGDNDVVWDQDEIQAISSLFKGRIPQKPGKFSRERALPLPLPYKLRPLGLPTPKKHVKLRSNGVSPRASVSEQVCRNPRFLIGLAREIGKLPPEENASKVLNKRLRFLRKGSLSLTIRELGHMCLPDKALQTFSWAQKQPNLFPDDRILASTVEVLARNHELKVPINLEKFACLANRGVIEAMVKGFIKGGSLNLAWKLLRVAKDHNRLLDSSIYAKLILELGKKPDRGMLALALLEELGEREDLNLSQQDCTAIMKICVRLRKFEIVASLFNWFKQSGHEMSVVVYTTMIHSGLVENKYREALPVVWEMEASNCLLDLPAYRVVIKLFAALNDLPRAVRYFSRLKEAGFSPTYDIYRAIIGIYLISGRLAKVKAVCKEAEKAGFKLDKQILSQLLLVESERR
ncbi:HMG box domain-containing protein [Psidium guajava]|nr:HMG box domain-containing protein [Psidium guajava]